MEATRHGRGLWAHTTTLSVAPPGATLASSTSLIRGMAPTVPHKRRFHVGSSSGLDSFAMDPWAHCHPLEGHQPTLQPPFGPNLHTCCGGNRLWEKTMTLQCNGGATEDLPAPSLGHPVPKAPLLPLYCLQIPPCSLVL